MTKLSRAVIACISAEAGSLIRLRGASSLRGRDPRVVGSFGVADLARDLGTGACVVCGSQRLPSNRDL